MRQKAVYLAAALSLLSAEVSMSQKPAAAGEKLELAHMHLGVRSLPAALAWFDSVFQWKPVFHDEHMAVLPVKPIAVILDKSVSDAVVTLSFQTNDVDKDFQRLIGRGAISLEAPNDKPYGVRGAYIMGPGSITIELEGPLKKRK